MHSTNPLSARIVPTLVAGAVCSLAHAQIPAFPGAEGFGAHASGGRGGDVYVVTNLNSSGTGSLRYGIENAPSSGGRTIVFAVSGYIPINYNSDTGNQTLRIVRNNITIAGQTAPGDGIGLKDGRILVTGSNTVIRNLRIRHGKNGGAGDCLNVERNATNTIIDHVTLQFSTDENISFFNSSPDKFSMQSSVSAWGLESHNAGGLWDLQYGSCHRSLWAHHKTRNPKARPYGLLEWVNNVTFDWGIGFIMGDSQTPADWKANVIGSYFLSPPGYTDNTALESASVDRNGNPNFSLFLDNCLHDADGDGQLNGTNKGYSIVRGSVYQSGDPAGANRYVRAASAFPGASGNIAIEVDDPLTAYKKVVSDSGAVRLDAGHSGGLRDEVDSLLFSNVVNQRHSRVSNENQLPVSNNGFGTLKTAPAPADSDKDGMPDFWEVALGWNVSGADHNTVFASTANTFFPAGTPLGYNRLEEYLHFRSVPHVKAGINTAENPTSVSTDLRKFTSGFSKSPVFSVAGVRGGSVTQYAANGTTVSANGPIVRFTPTEGFSGRAGFDFTVTDADGSTWTRQFAILVATEALPEPQVRINVEFDEGAPYSGTAAAPDAGTVWNIFPEMLGTMAHTLTDVAAADGTATPFDVSVTTTSGDGFKVYTNTATDKGNPNPSALMGDYAYGGKFSVTVRELPPGTYSLYVYAHGDAANQGSLVTVAAANGGGSATAGTTGTQYRNLSTSGAEGYSYLRFDPVVGEDGILAFEVDSYFNGFQLTTPPEENYFVNMTDQAGATGAKQTIGAMSGWGFGAAAPAAGTTWNVFNEATHTGATPQLAVGQVWTIVSNVQLTTADGIGVGSRMTVEYHAATDALSGDRLSTVAASGTVQSGGVMDRLMRNYWDRSGNGNFQRFRLDRLRPSTEYLLYVYGAAGGGSASWNARIDTDRNGTVDMITEDGLSTDALFVNAGGGSHLTTPKGQVWNMAVVSTDASGNLAFDSKGHLNGFQVVSYSAPEITAQPSDQEVNPGEQASFRVEAVAKPEPAYQWYRNGSPITGETGSILSISGVDAGDLGDYAVEVRNDGAAVMSAAATLGFSADPYSSYMTGFGLDPESDGAPEEDLELDGLANVIEFFLGTDPTRSDPPEALPAGSMEEGGFSYTFRRLREASETPFVVEYSGSMSGAWTEAVDGENGVTIVIDDSGDGPHDTITVTIPATLPRLFVRIRLGEEDES